MVRDESYIAAKCYCNPGLTLNSMSTNSTASPEGCSASACCCWSAKLMIAVGKASRLRINKFKKHQEIADYTLRFWLLCSHCQLHPDPCVNNANYYLRFFPPLPPITWYTQCQLYPSHVSRQKPYSHDVDLPSVTSTPGVFGAYKYVRVCY